MTIGTLRKRLAQPGIITAPGIYDPITALLAQRAGFEAVFLSGSAVAATHLAQPDVGLVSLTELADICARVTDRVGIPVVVDVDSAYGSAANAARTIRALEAAGASAVQVEDQALVKPDDALLSRPLIPASDMAAKIRAMADARRSEDVLISARTDAPAAHSIDETVDRLGRYKEAGADILFAEGIMRIDEVNRVKAVAGETPIVFNLLRPESEVTTAQHCEELGVAIALFPVTAIRAMTYAVDQAFAALRADPTSSGGPAGATPLPEILGTQAYLDGFKR